MASVITREFAKASERSATSPFCLIEQKGLLTRLGEELSRAANDLSHDPKGFFRDLLSTADTKDLKRRRLVYIGLGCALVAHAVFLTLMIIAGAHRILAPPTPDPGYRVIRLEPNTPLKPTESPRVKDATEGDAHRGGGGGDHSEAPASSGGLLPTLPTPAIVKPYAPATENPVLPVTPNVQGPEAPPPPPDTIPGDPNGKPGPLSAGRGEGEGIGDKTGSGIGPGNGAGVGPGNRGGRNKGDAGTLEGKGTAIGSLSFYDPKPAGYVPFSWIYRPTPVVTPEAQAYKSGGTVLLQATFRADGTITDIEIRNQVDYMTESAVESLKRSRFRPASINGIPITMFRVLVKIEIELSRRR